MSEKLAKVAIPSPSKALSRFFGTHAKNRLLNRRNGLQTVTAVLMLLLMFTALTVLIISYSNYNLSAQEQMNIDRDRSKEKIMLSQQSNQQLGIISSISIFNTGTIEVKIRALYKTQPGETIFICDPSTDSALNMDTHIAPSTSLTINLAPFEIDGQATIIAATERGVTTFRYEPIRSEEQEQELKDYDPTKLYVGPLMLKFDDFWYRKALSDGTLDPNDQWHPGWNVTTKLPEYFAWKITVMNIGERNITLNRFSSFNLVQNDSPSKLPWFIVPNTQLLQINQTVSVVFINKTPDLGSGAQYMTSTFSDCTCMVFLTFFGVFHETDGTTTPYAQTIPFEASVTIA